MISRTISLLSSEPFRVFFPLGLFLGTAGVMLWPLYVGHVIHYYPGTSHVRLMIEGLMGSFIIGFLGTAGPRLLETTPFRAVETFTLLGLQLLSALFHFLRKQAAGDVVFLSLLLLFLCLVGWRVRNKTKQVLPPPSFVLVLTGYGCAVVGIGLTIVASTTGNAPLFASQLGALMLNEGFVLLPILGVGAFFLRKLLGGARPDPTDLEIPAIIWRKKAGIAAIAAILILVSFALEAADWIRAGAALRGLTALVFFTTQGRLLQKPIGPAFLARCFRLGFLLIIVGLLLPIVLTPYRVANLHVTFLGGFCIVLFTVSTRVIVGHSGQTHLFQRRMPFLIVALILLLLAMSTRVAADFAAPIRNSHLAYAAFIWTGAAIAWAWALFPKLLVAEAHPPSNDQLDPTRGNR